MPSNLADSLADSNSWGSLNSVSMAICTPPRTFDLMLFLTKHGDSAFGAQSLHQDLQLSDPVVDVFYGSYCHALIMKHAGMNYRKFSVVEV